MFLISRFIWLPFAVSQSSQRILTSTPILRQDQLALCSCDKNVNLHILYIYLFVYIYVIPSISPYSQNYDPLRFASSLRAAKTHVMVTFFVNNLYQKLILYLPSYKNMFIINSQKMRYLESKMTWKKFWGTKMCFLNGTFKISLAHFYITFFRPEYGYKPSVV